MVNRLSAIAIVLAATLVTRFSLVAAPSEEGPQYTAEGRLLRPANYREWISLASGYNMTYGPLGSAMSGRAIFTNVFVAPSSYRTFLQTGGWPDKTVFILEGRQAIAVNKASNGEKGFFQGEVVAIEAEVKDESRFPGKWAFFGLGVSQPAGAQIPVAAECYSCHAKNAAVENTFVQFYPVLRDVAKQKGTLKAVPEVF